MIEVLEGIDTMSDSLWFVFVMLLSLASFR
jgi:hypothetical protein